MEETSIDLRDIWKTLKKRRRLIITIFLSAILLAGGGSFLIPPTYEAETNLRVKQSKGLADSLLADLPTSVGTTKQLMSTYAEILKSRTVVESVIEKTQQDKEKTPDYKSMLNRITTQPVKDTEILKVKVKAGSPEEAAEVANALVETFTDRLTELVRAEQSTVRKFIGERLKESKKELEQAENNLQKYKTQQQIVAPDEETKALVDRLANIDKLAAENKIALSTAQAKLSSAQSQLSKEKPGFVADSPLIQQHKGKLAELEVQLVSLTQNYSDKHPQVIAIRAAIEETRKKLNAEIAKVVNNEAASANPIHQGLLTSKLQAEAEIAAAMSQRQALAALSDEGSQELSQLPSKEQGLVRVMRDMTVAQEIYIMLAKRHEEARISEVMQPTDVQVIDVADVPERPVSPKKTLNVIIAAVLGLFIGVGIAFAFEYMNKTVRNAEDVEHYLGLPVLGNIPHFDSRSKRDDNTWWQKVAQLISKTGKKGG